ncbi:MAG: FtsW/RodA/SpoVE family cell cycle protein [Christensenella sp.]|uniref:FtsW/RodA/SpoVE family cell cycle protein n=1 Tax=Christensenella sp. TaxID=1935934 RepID=UPI002B1EB01C|nr:FtsW/RodA/SpoVE family cell cycle protein [Christensenella sp.]MEA5002358.1 FtsW/RodA/SpoVE family cell cycle protein [Christensenella sp.]
MKGKLINKNMWKFVDWFLVVVIFILVGYSLLSIANATASPFTGDERGIAEFIANLDLSSILWQALFFGIGLALMFLVMLVDYHTLAHLTDWLYWATVALLVAVYFLGSEQNGTTGWFMIGSRGFQPGELCKILMIIVLAKMLSNKTEGSEDGIQTFKDILPTLWRLAIPVVLIAIQPDIGTSLVYLFIFAVMLFMAKANWKVWLILIIIALAVFGGYIIYLSQNPDNYMWRRLLAFFNPQSEVVQSTNADMQMVQAQMAMGSGGFLGKGLFTPGSLSQLGYVWAGQDDFIFAVTVEAFGFLGGLILIILYFLLIGRTLMLSLRAKDDFGAYIIIGVAAMTLFHVVENIGMNIGLLPVTGIPLPFFSSGGSSMIMNCIAFGLVLSVDMRRQRWQGQ